MLSIALQNVVMLIVVAPFFKLPTKSYECVFLDNSCMPSIMLAGKYYRCEHLNTKGAPLGQVATLHTNVKLGLKNLCTKNLGRDKHTGVHVQSISDNEKMFSIVNTNSQSYKTFFLNADEQAK